MLQTFEEAFTVVVPTPAFAFAFEGAVLDCKWLSIIPRKRAKFNVMVGNTAITQGCVWLCARVATYGPSLCAVNDAAYSVSVCGNMQTVHSQLQR